MTNAEIKKFDRAERKAWNTMMRGSSADASSIFGQEGKNYLAWCAAADACRAARNAWAAEHLPLPLAA